MVSLGASSNDEEDTRTAQGVTLAKKRQVIQQWRKERNRVKKQNKSTRDEAICRRVQDILDSKSTPATVTSMSVPFKVHRSHRAFYIGGFALCVSCGCTQACGNKNHMLGKECRKRAPQGTLAVLRRTLSGKNPRGSEPWSDGSICPELHRLPPMPFSINLCCN